VGRAPEKAGGPRIGVSQALRDLRSGEETMFARWEAADRPYPWTAAQFRPGGAARVLVWEDDGRPLGFGVLQVVEEEAYLLNLMVDPEFRRRGTGAKLLQKVMIVARDHGARRLVLDVDAANGPALSLYAKAGFQTLDRRRAAYPRGEDAIVMKKDL
jgi:ribosomal-protein-alanine N-acetyltransferase